jgi:tripartite-type tricarboxylate transporter receptor subunit TctC
MKDAIWPSWFGLVGPAGTPKPIIEKLAAEIAQGWKDPDNIAKLRNVGFLPWTTKPEETARLYEAERVRWGEVIRANNIKAE